MRRIGKIVIHCAATKPDMDIGVEEIRRWHVDERGWRDIGYHYVIRLSGNIEVGRPLEEAGAHAVGHNQDSIGICLVGGLNDDGQPVAGYTDEQWRSLNILVGGLTELFWTDDLLVCGHNDLSPKTCPNFDVAKWLRKAISYDSSLPSA